MKTFLNCDAFLYYFNNKTIHYEDDWNDGVMLEEDIETIKNFSKKYTDSQIKEEFDKVIQILQMLSPVEIMFDEEFQPHYSSYEEQINTRNWIVKYLTDDFNDYITDESSYYVNNTLKNINNKIEMYPFIIEQTEDSLVPRINLCYLKEIKIDKRGDKHIRYCEIDGTNDSKPNVTPPYTDFYKLYNELFTITE